VVTLRALLSQRCCYYMNLQSRRTITWIEQSTLLRLYNMRKITGNIHIRTHCFTFWVFCVASLSRLYIVLLAGRRTKTRCLGPERRLVTSSRIDLVRRADVFGMQLVSSVRRVAHDCLPATIHLVSWSRRATCSAMASSTPPPLPRTIDPCTFRVLRNKNQSCDSIGFATGQALRIGSRTRPAIVQST